MKRFIKEYWKTLLFFTAIGIVGGFFTGLYLLDSYPDEIRNQLLAQGLTSTVLGVVTALQSAGYGLILGAAGIVLGKRIGLWKGETVITGKPLIASLIVSVIGGLSMILPDMLFFVHTSEALMDSYAAKPSIPYLLATVTYGAVIEEVMLRLFAMSLIAFILCKLFGKSRTLPTTSMLIAANVVTALLFAAAHLPTTFALLGSSAAIITRCFLLNGVLGLLFGLLYRKYGLRYAMIAHGGCHVVSKLIWLLFL